MSSRRRLKEAGALAPFVEGGAIGQLQLLWPAPAKAVPQAAALGRQLIGDAHPDERRLASRLAVDPAALAVAQGPDQQIVALTIVYGLAPAAVERIIAGLMTAGSSLQPSDIRASHAAGLYVAMVGGVDGHRVTALRLLFGQLGGLLTRHPAAAILFARAATGAGRRLLSRAGFAPLKAPSEVLSAPANPFRTALDGVEGWPDRHRLADIHRHLLIH